MKTYLLRIAPKRGIDSFNSLKQTSRHNRSWPKEQNIFNETFVIFSFCFRNQQLRIQGVKLKSVCFKNSFKTAQYYVLQACQKSLLLIFKLYFIALVPNE